MLDQKEWNEHYQNIDEVWAEPDSDLIAEAEGLPAGCALDLGAGEGINSLWLAEQGWQVTAVDFAPAAVAKIEREARQRLPGGEYEKDGYLTEAALAEIRSSVPELDPARLVAGLRKTDLPSLLTVSFFVRLIARKLAAQPQETRDA